jgi:hypothetical protein
MKYIIITTQTVPLPARSPQVEKGEQRHSNINDINTSRADISPACFGLMRLDLKGFKLVVEVCYASVARCSLSGRSLLATHFNMGMKNVFSYLVIPNIPILMIPQYMICHAVTNAYENTTNNIVINNT